jgi:hypothetical protein
MGGLVAKTTSEFATRTSRRGFIARSGKMLLGIVGGGVVAAATAQAAFAANCDCGHGICSSTCPYPSCNQNPPQAHTCYACNTCSNQRCCCTGVTC